MRPDLFAVALVAALGVTPALAQTSPRSAQELAQQQAQGLAQDSLSAPPAPPAAPAPQAARAREAAPVGGRYLSRGANLDGSPYEGEAEITTSGRDRCRITWRTGKRSVQKGICMRAGERFVASYQFREGAIGIVVYVVQPDGALNGEWVIADTNGRGVEILTPMR